MKPETWVALCGVIAAILVGIATIIAIVRGPIVALRIQRAIEDERATKNRKLWIFKTLMSNRATRMAPVFVQALNLIDVEFTARSEEHTSELQSLTNLVCRLLLDKKQCCMGPPDDAALKLVEREQQLLASAERRSA